MGNLRFVYISQVLFFFLCILPFAAAARIAAQSAIIVNGVVTDPSSAVVPGAEVQALGPLERVIAAARTDGEGRFALTIPSPGAYVIVVRAPGFADVRTKAEVPFRSDHLLEIMTGMPAAREEVSVTATLDRADAVAALAQPANIIEAGDIALRAKSVVAQAAAEEVGLHLQRTSASMAGVFVRGLTGNKVNVFMDGVRYSTGAQRGGVSTFFNLIEPTTLDVVEVLRGPNSAQYGSDALGGSLQFISRVPSIGAVGRRRAGGAFAVGTNTADTSVDSHLTGSLAATNLGIVGTVAVRRIDDLRAGGGVDSHAAVTRFLGVASDRLMDAHLQGTGFTQYGGNVMLQWKPAADMQVVSAYRRGVQNGGKRYDQLLGGDGNLIADLSHLTLDLFYARYEQLGVGWFDDASVTASVNSQREERVNQGGNGNPRATITREPERTTAYGVQGMVRKQLAPRYSLVAGGDFYPEHITAPSTGLNPVTGVVSLRRGRVPDGASYLSGGAYAQIIADPVPARLRLVGNARVNGASYTARALDSPNVNGARLWPDDHLRTTGVAFRGGMVAYASDGWSFTANVSRGFRAPHITDLGTLGLTGAGFEVTALELAGLGAKVGSTADATAVSIGAPVDQVGPETSLSTEGGIHFRSAKVRTSLSIFVNNVNDNIAKQSLILPQGAVGTMLGGTPITAQNANGVVFVAAATNPVLVRVNFGDARIVGVEHTFEWRPAPAWQFGTTLTYLRAKDTRTGEPPNIEGGTPAPESYVRATYTAPTGRWWAGAYAHVAGSQARLSTLDLEDRRTGATRTRTSIRSFFINGATARGWVSPGPDGTPGTADDVLTLTGETVAQIQDRVLGAGVNSAPLFTEVAGFFTLGLRGGIHFGRHEIAIDAENVGDRNYRGISSGMDAPGRSISARYLVRF